MAEPQHNPDPRRPSREGSGDRLSRGSIVQAAIIAIDRRGAPRLTMRGLGQDLGVEAMALYRYVTGREDLLAAVVGELLAGVRADLDEG